MRSFPDRDYLLCARCGEYDNAALSVIHGTALCRNCRATGATQRVCSICGKLAPSERHHIASKRQVPTLTLPICLNCHATLSHLQGAWDPVWKTQQHPVFFLLQGLCDVLVVWLERGTGDHISPEFSHLICALAPYLQAVSTTLSTPTAK